MLICSCNHITRSRLEQVINALLDADPFAPITPGHVYQAMAQRGQCCGCFPGVAILIDQQIRRRQPPKEPPDWGCLEPALDVMRR